jgi:hypothetical protein
MSLGQIPSTLVHVSHHFKWVSTTKSEASVHCVSFFLLWGRAPHRDRLKIEMCRKVGYLGILQRQLFRNIPHQAAELQAESASCSRRQGITSNSSIPVYAKITLGDNVPVFSYLLNGDHFSRPSVIKRSNRRRFGFGMTHTIKRNMPNWTPKNPLIVLKLRPIPPSAQGVSFTIWQLCHCLSTGCATVLLPPGDRINRQAKRRGMMGRNWVCFRTFDLRI